MAPNSVYTDTGVRITIDIDEAGKVALSPYHSATWNFRCQYNNSNMPDALAVSPRRTKIIVNDCFRNALLTGFSWPVAVR